MTALRNRIARALNLAERNRSATAAGLPDAEAPDTPPAAVLTQPAASTEHAGGTGVTPSSDAGAAWARAVAAAAENTRVQALLAGDAVVTEAGEMVGRAGHRRDVGAGRGGRVGAG